jgi:aspartate kinase
VVNREIVVVKIGGSLLEKGRDFSNLAKMLRRNFQDNQIIVVVSAMKGVTDQLIQVARGNKRLLRKVYQRYLQAAIDIGGESIDRIEKQLNNLALLSRSRNKQVTDEIIGYGEILSKTLMIEALKNAGFDVNSVSATRLFVAERVDGIARIDYYTTRKRIEKLVLENKRKGTAHIVEGFIAANRQDETITLGRGGSDYTATTLGSLLGSKHIYLYTITGAVLSGDPQLVRKPKLVPEMDYEEAAAASLFRVKGFHPLTFEPVRRFNHSHVIIGDPKSPIHTKVHNGINNLFPSCKPKIVSYKKQAVADIHIAVIGRCSKKKVLVKRVRHIMKSLGTEKADVLIPRRRPYISIRVREEDSSTRLVEQIHDNLVMTK